MKKRTKIAIGIAVFVVTMGLIVTAVVLAILSGKKNAELYNYEYTFVSDTMVDGAHIAVLDGDYVLVREGSILSDRYVYLSFVGDGRVFYRDDRGGRGYLNTDGKALGKVRKGQVCAYAEDGYAVLIEDETIHAGDNTYAVDWTEPIVEDYALNAALPQGMILTERAGELFVRDGERKASLGARSSVHSTGVRGLLSTNEGIYSLVKHSYIELAGAVYSSQAVYMGEWALSVVRADQTVLYNGAGDKIALADGETTVELQHVVKRDGATYAVPYTFVVTETGSYKQLRDGRLTEIGTVFETDSGLYALAGDTVRDMAGKVVRTVPADAAPVAGAYAVEYTKAGEHYIEPLDGKAFACPVGTVALWDHDGETVYASEDGGKLTVYDRNGKQTDAIERFDGERFEVVGGRIVAIYDDGAYIGKTKIDGISADGRFAFRTEQGKLTVIKTDTMAEYYYYTAGALRLETSAFGTIVYDDVSKLYGFISRDGKLTVKPSYTSLNACDGYLTASVDGNAWSILDDKGKTLYGGIENYTDMGICAYVETVSGQKQIVDARGRALVKDVTAQPEVIEQYAVVNGREVHASKTEQVYYRLYTGKIRVLRSASGLD